MNTPLYKPRLSTSFLIVDDHALVREGVVRVISGTWPHAQIQHAATLAEARQQLTAPGAAFDTVVLDLNLGDSDGIQTLKTMRAAAPTARVAVVSANNDLDLALACLHEGACAFIPKMGSIDHFVRGLQTLASGGTYFPRDLLAQAQQREGSPSGVQPVAAISLTPRQHEVLHLLLQGLTNTLIANELGISAETVKLHVSAILRSYGVANRVQLLLACAGQDDSATPLTN
jgi:DNA-binding NarL/FixJ family response regulator